MIRATRPCALLLCSLPLTAQDQPRGSMAGQVLDFAGAPVAGALITLAHRPIPWLRAVGETEVLQARSDARGRFRVALRRGARYSAFASWRRGNEAVVTVPREDAMAGAVIELRAEPEPQPDLSLRIQGAQAWQAEQPLRYRLHLKLGNACALPLEPDAAGRVRIPALPGHAALLEVQDRQGHALWGRWIARSRSLRQQRIDTGQLEHLHTETLKIPAPKRRKIQVVDADTGVPLPGAEVKLLSIAGSYAERELSLERITHTLEFWRPAGTTDRVGMLSLRYPSGGLHESRYETLRLLVGAKGRANVQAGWLEGRAFAGNGAYRGPRQLLRILLPREAPVTGRLTRDGSKPLPGCTVALILQLPCSTQRHALYHLNHPVMLARTDAEGRFRFAQAPRSNQGFRVVAIHDFQGADPGLPHWQWLYVPERRPRNLPWLRDRDLSVADLCLDQGLQVDLRDSRGNPVRGARVVLMDRHHLWHKIDSVHTSDGTGRCMLLRRSQDDVVFVRAAGIGYAVALPQDRKRIELVLRPFAQLRGRLLLPDDKPAGGAFLTSRHCGRVGPRPRATLHEQLARRSNSFNCFGFADAEGRFSIDYIPLAGHHLDLRAGGAALRGLDPDFRLELKEDQGAPPIEVKLAAR